MPLPLRVLCTFVVLGTALLAGWFMSRWGAFAATFESMVDGGVQALPLVQRLMLENPVVKFALLGLLTLTALLIIWRNRSSNKIVLTSVLTAVILITLSISGTYLLAHTMQIVTQKISR